MNTIDLSGDREAKVLLKKKILYRELDSWIDINASISEVWNILTDFESWENWNSFIPMVQGEFEVGKKMSIKVVSPGMKEMFFKPKIYSIEINKRISWGGSFLIFVYKGTHEFLLEYIDYKVTRFRQIERFKGPIILLMQKMITKTAIGYQNMNQEFKQYVENDAARHL
ncbi:MAG: SRPBCC family protein [Halanaerobium sp.]